ncbi:XRE family transcriptional regulator [Pseudonocardia lacus]|uniref:XRE family transcriptional regulator n=1 Tax=Pseudonocardia lacus TaxID=2835865 RepID=UPI001BDD9F14|nr:XRE family transcriptional regulator [Pseudonocardia lacus]
MDISPQEREFGAEVARSRDRAGVTQDWVARTIGVSRSKVSEMCAGRYLPAREVLDALVVALAMDRDATVERWTAAREGRRGRRHQEQLDRTPHPAGWSALPPLPREVQTLLTAQVQAARTLPYRLPGSREPSLATVYVRQHLGSGAEDVQPEPVRREVVLDGRGNPIDVPAAPIVRQQVRPLARTVAEVLDADTHLLVTGGPGQGKSTLSLRLAAEVAQCWTGGTAPLTEPVLPCRLSARELASRLGRAFPQALADTVNAEYGALLSSAIPARLFERRVAGCRWLLLVDGLDEVADDRQRDRLITVLAARAESADSAFRIVLTTRPLEGAALGPLLRIGATGYELLPFDDDALRTFADSWFTDVGDDCAHRFTWQIRAAHLDELVRVPLLATIAAIVFEQHADRPLPDNQYELYESYLRFLRTARTAATNRFAASCDRLLEHLGRERLETDASLVATARAWAERHLDPGLLVAGWQDELIAFLAIVGPLTQRRGDLQFLHHSFAEHLAATAQARLLPPGFAPDQEDFRRLLLAAQPEKRGRFARSVLVHFAHLHPSESSRMIDWLHRGTADQHLLAARLLAGRVRADAPVVDAFLATVRGWAMTHQRPGSEILEQASRAAHHPGLPAWLLELMRDDGAPWRSRTEAATAFATRLRGPHTEEALIRLRSVVDDADVEVDHRLAAAEALSQCAGVERAAAERGLRAVLDDPTASGAASRVAAVVLAGLGSAARLHATTALSDLLTDPWTPLSDLVQVAEGLVEISFTHHEQCAAAFRTVLHAGRPGVAFRSAAVGLAGLGHGYSQEVTALLDSMITDPRQEDVVRTGAADALAELGPQHRTTAGRGLVRMLGEPGPTADRRLSVARSLVKCGGSFRDEAEAILDSLLADPAVSASTQLDAARIWIDEGSHHPDDVAQLLHSVLRACPSGTTRTSVLGHMARLGEPHRSFAVAALRADMNDHDAPMTTRCYAYDELISLGPEHHEEAAAALLRSASRDLDAGTQVQVWQRLSQLNVRYREVADLVICQLLLSDDPEVWHYAVLNPGHLADLAATTGALLAALADPQRPRPTRTLGIRTLSYFGRAHHRAVVDAALQLLRSGDSPHQNLSYWLSAFENFGVEPRRLLARALRETAAGLDAYGVAQAAAALRRIGDQPDQHLLDLLENAVSDEAERLWSRSQPAALLPTLAARTDAAELVSLVLPEPSDESTSGEDLTLLGFARIGLDIGPELRALLASAESSGAVTVTAASVLAELQPDSRSEMSAHLRRIGADTHLPLALRLDAMTRLAGLEPAAHAAAVAMYRSALADDSISIDLRCSLARDFTRLDRNAVHEATEFLRRCASDPTALPTERAHAVSRLWYLESSWFASGWLISCAQGVTRDPAADPVVRRRAGSAMPGRESREVDLDLLTDATAWAITRVPPTDIWGRVRQVQHQVEVEPVLREVFAAPESRLAGKVNAAVALGELGSRSRAEAVELLAGLAHIRTGAVMVWRALAGLGREGHRRAVAAALAVVDDETAPARTRNRAACFVATITKHVPDPVLARLRAQAQPGPTPGNVRLAAAHALIGIDGLGPLRAIRDDDRERPALRWRAVHLLPNGSAIDRVAAVRVLSTIASDSGCRLPLRWRAARDLVEIGERGHQLGCELLRAMTEDDAASDLTRAHAAKALALARPDTRGDCARLLRRLAPTPDPMHRILVLEALGVLDSEWAAAALRTMATDGGLGAVARVRSAGALAGLRRDQREAAAAVARDIAHDAAVAPHVRATAARGLARWSRLCRDEARKVLRELRHPAEARPTVVRPVAGE